MSTFDLLDFIIAVVHVSYHRYAAELPSQATYTQLSIKLVSLFGECFSVYTFPDLSKKLDRFSVAVSNAAAQLLMKKGRKYVAPSPL